MFKRVYLYVILAFTSLVGGCLTNDIPYPYIELYITSVEGDGFSTSINNINRSVTLTLDEQTDIQAVSITSVETTEGAELSSEVVGTFDMRLPITTTLYQYQSYDWTIEAQQSIEYYFKVAKQIGSERIDLDRLEVEVDVDESSYDPTNVSVISMKLGAADVSSYSPTAAELTNFESFQWVDVTQHGRSERWKVTIIPIEASVSLSVDVWGKVAWLTGYGVTDDIDACGFRYKESSQSDWIEVAAESANGGIFETKLEGLAPSTEYDFQAYVGSMESIVVEKQMTESTPELPNGGFEEWYEDGGGVIFPYLEGASGFWDSGNTGSKTGGKNITTADYSEVAPGTSGSSSAQLNSENVVIKFAAGNILTGEFVSVAGASDGIIRFGQSFSQRPQGLRFWAKYDCGVVTHASNRYGSYKLNVGDDDQGVLYIMLGEWTKEEYGYDSTGVMQGTDSSPWVVDTRSESTFITFDNSAIIAYAEVIFTESTDWQEFELELEYRDGVDSSGNVIPGRSRVPTNIMIVASSSRYGDYFTGSENSMMWLDDMELVY